LSEALAALGRSGAEVLFASAALRSVRAVLDVRELETIAALPAVRFIHPKQEFFTNKSTTTEGDVTHRAHLVRASLGYTGNGQKICVISDGVSTIAGRQASGDLPAIVEVLPGQAGVGDEGTALLEIVHDVAPGARLGFATGAFGIASFAQNILDLADPAKGACTVIVDDLDYTSEPTFQSRRSRRR
jgi:hypothetical protein